MAMTVIETAVAEELAANSRTAPAVALVARALAQSAALDPAPACTPGLAEKAAG